MVWLFLSNRFNTHLMVKKETAIRIGRVKSNINSVILIFKV
jgi:hypothetical protein